MYLRPPRPQYVSSVGRPYVGQPQNAEAAAAEAQRQAAAAQQAAAAKLETEDVKLRKIIREELQLANGGAAQQQQESSGGGFWGGLWGFLGSAGGELLTAALGVIGTLYAREWYAQSRLKHNEDQAARVAMDLATPSTEIEQMTTEELEEETNRLLEQFYKNEDDTSQKNIEVGQRLQVSVELLIKKKSDALKKVNEQIEEEERPEVVDRLLAKGDTIADEIEELENEWDAVTDHLDDLIRDRPEVEKFRQLAEE